MSEHGTTSSDVRLRPMGPAEREAFLAGARVAVVSVADEDGRAPLSLPMWFGYAPGGDLTLITAADSRKARLIERRRRLSLCVQDTEPPRTYVTVEGPVVEFRAPATEAERRALAHRYLGPEAGDAFVAASPGATARSVLIRVRPERWLSRGAF
ncbi:pyridoxamine 5'-phosphate oxidase family protein [Streptomyces sp. NPDC005435]|uniref:pyridoxamine 5'-phosphate oxidase family protein n=1 Tax=Streptomyces sp. NPDC005435 TaxID=3154464 RepID=UPI0034531057